MRRARWSDDDKYFGPFTWSWGSSHRPWAIVLGSRDDEDRSCTLRISANKATFIVALPNIIRPYCEKVYPQGWSAETIERLGRNYYWNIDQRQYGFSLSNGFLQIYYGRTGGRSCDSTVEQRWSYFLPWTQTRHVRHSFYGLDGEHFCTLPDGPFLETFEQARKAKEACPVVAFSFADHDGERLVASTRIEEREWHQGTGWFKWLSWFRKPIICRSLNIEFSGETGKEKGSWKGGTVGTGIDMLPGELHEAAFRRYCDQEHRSKHGQYKIQFLSVAALAQGGADA